MAFFKNDSLLFFLAFPRSEIQKKKNNCQSSKGVYGSITNPIQKNDVNRGYEQSTGKGFESSMKISFYVYYTNTSIHLNGMTSICISKYIHVLIYAILNSC